MQVQNIKELSPDKLEEAILNIGENPTVLVKLSDGFIKNT